MKRFLIIFIIFCVFVSNSFSTNYNYSRFSFTAEYGFTYFYGDLAPVPPILFPNSLSNLVYGFTVEYALSPIWGLSADYYHLPISGKNQIAFFETDISNSDLNVTFNFTKWIFPQSKSKFNVNGSLGVGFALFNSEYRYPDPVNSPLQNSAKNNFATALPVSFSTEYSLSNSLTLGFRAHYRAFNTDNLEGVPYLNFKGVTNDYVALLSITARYKLNATKKTHLRNMNIYEFIEMSDLSINGSDSCNTCDAIKLAKANTNAIDSLQNSNMLLKLQLDTVMTLLSNYSVDTDGDGVTDFMDRCPATPSKVRGLVDKRGCPLDSDLDAIPDYLDNCPTIPGVPSNQGCPEIKQEVKALFKQALQGIQFETNKADIKPESSVILDKIVDILIQNADYLIEIQGHTDNVGKSTANLILSDNRAQAVLKYLTDKGLSKERFTARGFGDTKPVVSNKTEQGKAENRRVEFVVKFKE